MIIKYDHREEPSDVPNLLREFRIPIEKVNNMDIGDYIIDNFCIERKEASDYISSLIDGRLNDQLYNMSTNYAQSVVILEGNLTAAMIDSGVARNSVYSSQAGTIVKRSPEGLRGVISWLNSNNKYDTALIIRFLWKKFDKKQMERLPTLQKASMGPGDWSINVLSAFPGINKGKAKKILVEFPTLESIFNAKIEDICGIKDIGPVTAKTIKKILIHEYKVIKNEI